MCKSGQLDLQREFFAQMAAGTERIEHGSKATDRKERLEDRHSNMILLRHGQANKGPGMLVD
jgi:hypothetical protein